MTNDKLAEALAWLERVDARYGMYAKPLLAEIARLREENATLRQCHDSPTELAVRMAHELAGLKRQLRGFREAIARHFSVSSSEHPPSVADFQLLFMLNNSSVYFPYPPPFPAEHPTPEEKEYPSP